MPRKTLPTFYYHSHFLEFLEFVRGPSAHLLNQDQKAFLSLFDTLDTLSQCTLVRLLNRKGRVVKIASLVFAEIPSIEQELNKLAQHGLVSALQTNHHSDFIAALTKAELFDLYTECADANMPAIKKSIAKPALLESCAKLNREHVVASVLAQQYVVTQCEHHIAYFLFLYFGHNKGLLNQFSMRDLGLMRTRDEQAQMQSRFSDYESAFSSFSLQGIAQALKNQCFTGIADIEQFSFALPTAHGEQAQSYLDKINFLLAKLMLNFDANKALNIAAGVNSAIAQEFWCRQAYKLGLKSDVQEKLEAIINDPLSEHILQFAEDFLARKYKQKRTSVLTDMLRENNRHLSIDETYKGAVESGVVAYYKARNIEAWRTENTLWNNLFGLVFWHELFNLEGLGLATPFDHLPLCIKQQNFMSLAEHEIQTRLAAFDTSNALYLHLTKSAAAHFGKSQGIVRWHPSMLEKLQTLVTHAPLEGLKKQLLLMCSNYKLYNDGYPDIMVLENNKLRFEEIKGTGDSLRRNQLAQIQALKQHGFDVGITTVEYQVDPMQAYAVVDIETTGGRAGNHKITEIGIVKMVNGEVVDQWQSLLNPQRRIPGMITRLTGISDDMVADAPLFIDIADELEQFTEDCVFVAHNVNFDYGFIREEFARINRHYKRPKLCTVQTMRQHYKGLASYSLANLSKHFNINMQQHHRALSDAIAAAELLKLVNQARMAEQ